MYFLDPGILDRIINSGITGLCFRTRLCVSTLLRSGVVGTRLSFLLYQYYVTESAPYPEIVAYERVLSHLVS